MSDTDVAMSAHFVSCVRAASRRRQFLLRRAKSQGGSGGGTGGGGNDDDDDDADADESSQPVKRSQVERLLDCADAFLLEASSESIIYEYDVQGVNYNASQDVQLLSAYLPEQPERLIGPVNIKYMVRNPANSIVVCEYWSGIRAAQSYQQQKKGSQAS